jgi:hypothetical protein
MSSRIRSNRSEVSVRLTLVPFARSERFVVTGNAMGEERLARMNQHSSVLDEETVGLSGRAVKLRMIYFDNLSKNRYYRDSFSASDAHRKSS